MTASKKAGAAGAAPAAAPTEDARSAPVAVDLPPRDDTGAELVHVALPLDVAETIAAAAGGDAFAWGHLYGMASALVSAGHALPEPLRHVVAERLAALGDVLTRRPLKDARKVVHQAAVPFLRIRLVGPKKKSRARLAAEAAIDLIDRPLADGEKRYGRRLRIIDTVAKVAGEWRLNEKTDEMEWKPLQHKTVETAIGKLRKESGQKSREP